MRSPWQTTLCWKDSTGTKVAGNKKQKNPKQKLEINSFDVMPFMSTHIIVGDHCKNRKKSNMSAVLEDFLGKGKKSAKMLLPRIRNLVKNPVTKSTKLLK